MNDAKEKLRREAIKQTERLLDAALVLMQELGASVHIKAEMREPGTHNLMGRVDANLKRYPLEVREIYQFMPDRGYVIPNALSLKVTTDMLFDTIMGMTMEDSDE